eukprot:763461-Hanusia_phi.AAC.1
MRLEEVEAELDQNVHQPNVASAGKLHHHRQLGKQRAWEALRRLRQAEGVVALPAGREKRSDGKLELLGESSDKGKAHEGRRVEFAHSTMMRGEDVRGDFAEKLP